MSRLVPRLNWRADDQYQSEHIAMLELSSIRTSEGKLEIVNQLLLPHTTQYLEIKTIDDAFDAIKSMKVGTYAYNMQIRALLSSRSFSLSQIRGAPAIASLASLAVADYLARMLSSSSLPEWFGTTDTFKQHVETILAHLFTARPTAVNLGAATRQLYNKLQTLIDAGNNVQTIAQELIIEAKNIDAEDVGRNKLMSKWGGEWLVERAKSQGGSGTDLNVMTVCNTGSLATSVCQRNITRYASFSCADMQIVCGCRDMERRSA